jgi:hypothetical protein
LGSLIAEAAMVIYPPSRIKMGEGMEEAQTRAAAALSPRQPEHHKQCAIEMFGCFRINMADDAPNPVMAESDHFVRHNLRAKAKAIRWFGFDNRPERQPFLKV